MLNERAYLFFVACLGWMGIWGPKAIAGGYEYHYTEDRRVLTPLNSCRLQKPVFSYTVAGWGGIPRSPISAPHSFERACVFHLTRLSLKCQVNQINPTVRISDQPYLWPRRRWSYAGLTSLVGRLTWVPPRRQLLNRDQVRYPIHGA